MFTLTQNAGILHIRRGTVHKTCFSQKACVFKNGVVRNSIS